MQPRGGFERDSLPPASRDEVDDLLRRRKRFRRHSARSNLCPRTCLPEGFDEWRDIALGWNLEIGNEGASEALHADFLFLPSCSPSARQHRSRRGRRAASWSASARNPPANSFTSFATSSRAASISLTVGQYLQPTPAHLPVVRYVPPAEFADYRESALAVGFRHESAPSSAAATTPPIRPPPSSGNTTPEASTPALQHRSALG